MRSRCLRARSPLLAFVLPYAFGVVAGRLGLSPPVWVALLGAAVLLAGAWRSLSLRPRWWPALFCAALFCGGDAGYLIHRHRVAAREALPPREVEALVRCERVFASSKAGQCSLIGRLSGTDAHLAELRGQRVYLSYRLPRKAEPPLPSSVLQVRGVLAPLVVAEGTRDFSAYLAECGVGFRLQRVGVVTLKEPPGWYSRLLAAASARFARILEEGILAKRPDLAAILKAMLLGRASDLSAEQRDRYVLSGTMHLFAISGLHIAVIATALGGMIALFPLAPAPRFVMGAVLLWFYVDATGGTPSALRSYQMVIAVQVALLGRRQGSALSGLCLAAAWTLVCSPLDFFGAGFQMSFGIVAALLLLGQPLAEELLQRVDPFAAYPAILRTPLQALIESVRLWAIPTLSLSLAAALVSLVSGVAFFGVLSHGSILANLLMIPVSVLVIYAGFIALVCGLLGLMPLAGLFNHAGALVLWGMDAVLAWFVALPGVYAPLAFRPAWLGGAGLGALVLLMLGGYAGRWGRRGRWLWLPFAFTVGLLLLGSRIPPSLAR